MPGTFLRAVWFHFIPLFNIYWMFKWPVELARMLNEKAGRTIVPGTILGISVFFGFALLRFDTAIGLSALSLWMAFVLNRVYRVVDQRKGARHRSTELSAQGSLL